MKNFKFIVALAFALLAVSPAQADDAYTKTIELFEGSAVKPFFKNSYGYAVFPSVGKVAVGVGGSYGEGQVYQGGKVTGKATLRALSVGVSLGGQAISEVIFFENKRVYDEFTGGKYELDAQASAMAISAGVQAQAGTSGTAGVRASGGTTPGLQLGAYHKGIAVFTHAKSGLMYDMAVSGQKFSFEPLAKK